MGDTVAFGAPVQAIDEERIRRLERQIERFGLSRQHQRDNERDMLERMGLMETRMERLEAENRKIKHGEYPVKWDKGDDA